MESLCQESPKQINFFINSMLHITILLAILSLFYFLYVSNLSRDKFHEELKSTVDDNLNPALEKADTDGNIKKILKNIDLQNMINFYKNDSKETTLQNNWIKRFVFTILIFLLILIIVSIFITKIFCKKIPILDIIKENVIMFSLVGTVEILFFLNIAKNFVPTKPSLLMKSIIDSLKKNFN